MTVTLAIIGGLLTLNGYAYLERFYNTLDIPVARLNLSGQVLLAYGGVGIGSALLAWLTVFCASAFITISLALLEKPGRTISPNQPKGFPARIIARAREIILPLKWVWRVVVIVVVANIVWKFALQDPLESGRRAAINVIKKCTEQTLFYQSETRTGCVITESDDMFYLIKRLDVSETTVSFKASRLPKAGFLKSLGATQTLNVKAD